MCRCHRHGSRRELSCLWAATGTATARTNSLLHTLPGCAQELGGIEWHDQTLILQSRWSAGV